MIGRNIKCLGLGENLILPGTFFDVIKKWILRNLKG